MGRHGLAAQALGPTVTIGEVLVEVMAVEPGFGFCAPLRLAGPFASGAPAIFAAQCAALGAEAGIVAAVGADDFGRLNLARLAGFGVDVSAVEVVEGWPTGSAFVRYRPDGERDFVFNIERSAAGRVAWSAAGRALVARAGHLHVMGSALAIPHVWAMLEEALAVVVARGGSVSLDPNLRKELGSDRLAQVVGVADLVMPSGEELFVAAGVEGERAALAALFGRGVGEVVVKRGAAGASWFGAAGGRVDVAGFEVAEVDPTGAGDCFGGAFVACRRLGMDVTRSLTYACAAGARNVGVMGPMEGVATQAGLDHFIAVTGQRPHVDINF